MSKYDEIKQELKDLVKEGKKLYEAILLDETDNCHDLSYFVANYERWYSKALPIVKQLQPNRFNDFSLLYKNEKRKEITLSNYTISDALRTLSHRQGYYGPHSASYCMLRQVNMLQACLDTFDSKLNDILTIVQADIFDSEIETAKHLHKRGFLRAAGAICGVVLEKHFATVCDKRSITLKKKNPTIADYNDALKDNAYDTIEWRRIQRLGDIRNLCDHSKDREPTKDEVEELISGTERTIKTVF